MIGRANPGVGADDARAIEDLHYWSSWLVDHGQANRLPETLAPDGVVYGLGPDPMDFSAFSAWAKARAERTARQTRHVVSNVRLFPLDDGRIRGTSTLMIWAIEGTDHPTLDFIGDQEDVFERSPQGRWMILERRLVPMRPPGVQLRAR